MHNKSIRGGRQRINTCPVCKGPMRPCNYVEDNNVSIPGWCCNQHRTMCVSDIAALAIREGLSCVHNLEGSYEDLVGYYILDTPRKIREAPSLKFMMGEELWT